MTIKIMLSAANMGPQTTEADFDAWAGYVCNHIDEAMGFEVADVDQFRFIGGAGGDRIDGASDEQREAIRSWLAVAGWEAFCVDMDERARLDAAVCS